jgi:cellulose synthase/poly-beta-1,6-N-acetylglucosamine synthase-like glycosyltransferase
MFGKLSVVTLIIALALAPLILLTFCFAVEVILGLWRLKLGDAPSTNDVNAVILVPAHNEEAVLHVRLAALKEASQDRARILLVADNCSDSTAEIARGLGVEVIERADAGQRGKGYALDFARHHLESAPPAVVLIVDADCTIDAGSIDRLIARCAATGSPCQATNLQAPAPDGSPTVQLSTFAFFIKNVIRQRGLYRIARRVNLLGTGMALPWSAFSRADLATGNIVEDLKLGQELAEAGHPPVFAEDATVWSKAETEQSTLSQRGRWEGGFLQNAVRVAPRLFLRNLRRGNPRGTWAAINLMIPPFALLILLDMTALGVASIAGRLSGAAAWPPVLLFGALLFAAIALILAWIVGGSRFVTLGGLARVPLYIAWKLPLYLGFARRGVPREWVRTGRENS